MGTSLNAITPQQTHSPSQRADHHHGRSRLHPQVCPVLRNGWHLLRDDFRMYWSSIWHSEVRNWNCRCWNLPARLDHEVIDPRRHVRYHRSLLASYCGFDCGLSVGLTGLAAGYAIGIVGDMGVRSYMQQSRIFVGMVLILIFGEVLGLYGLIVALILNTKSRG